MPDLSPHIDRLQASRIGTQKSGNSPPISLPFSHWWLRETSKKFTPQKAKKTHTPLNMMNFEEGQPDRRLLFSLISGALFAGAWVIFADGYVFSDRSNEGRVGDQVYKPYTFKDWTPGLVGTLAFILVNMMSPNALVDESLDDRDINLNKCWFFFALLVTFTSLTLAIVFHIDTYSKQSGDASYPGVALIIQTLALAIASLMFFFTRGKKVCFSNPPLPFQFPQKPHREMNSDE